MGLLGLSYGMNHKSESYCIMTASAPEHMLELWTAFEVCFPRSTTQLRFLFPPSPYSRSSQEEVITAQKRMQKLIDDLTGVPEQIHGEREEDFIKRVYKDVRASKLPLPIDAIL